MASESHPSVVPNDHLTLHTSENTLSFTQADIDAALDYMRSFVADDIVNLRLDFSVWDFTRPQHLGMYLGMFVKQRLVQDSLTLQSLFEFGCVVSSNYCDTPYHSFFHAMDMTYMTYYMLIDMGLRLQLDLNALDVAALLIAALGHDVLHPGTNNLFQTNAKTEVAVKFNNQSVLENNSLELVTTVLAKFDFVGGLYFEDIAVQPSKEESASKIGSIVSDSILKTDMIYHFRLLEQLAQFSENAELLLRPPVNSSPRNQSLFMMSMKKKISSATSQQSALLPEKLAFVKAQAEENANNSNSSVDLLPKYNLKDAIVKQQILNIILHAADISNPARPFKLSQKWANCVSEEFYKQGELEAKMGLPISPNMDREATNQVAMQLAFIEFIVRPYFTVLAETFPRMVSFTDVLRENCDHWNELREPCSTDTSDTKPTSATLTINTRSSILSSPKRKNTDSSTMLSPDSAYLGSGASSRRLSMAAGTVDIPESVEALMTRVMQRPHGASQMSLFSSRSNMSPRIAGFQNSSTGMLPDVEGSSILEEVDEK